MLRAPRSRFRDRRIKVLTSSLIGVIVTGSNIPTAEETAPNPVDTYRPQDTEKLGIRNATDLQEFIPPGKRAAG